MTQLVTSIKQRLAIVLLAFAVAGICGCGTSATFTNAPGLDEFPDGPQEVFNRGDLVTITFSSPVAIVDLKPHEERVKGDGSITPPQIGSVVAAGKTPGELQRDLQEKYDRLYKNLTVTVKSELRYYYVEGEVRTPGPKPYLGETDLVKAISSAGGFTEFARKGKIQLRRPGRATEYIDYHDAIDDAARNLPVYPGDTIYVPRRIL